MFFLCDMRLAHGRGLHFRSRHGTLLSDSAGCVVGKMAPVMGALCGWGTSFRSFDSSSSSSPADAVRRPEGQSGLRGGMGAAHSLRRHRVMPLRACSCSALTSRLLLADLEALQQRAACAPRSGRGIFVELSAPGHADTSTFVGPLPRRYLLAFLAARAIAMACWCDDCASWVLPMALARPTTSGS